MTLVKICGINSHAALGAAASTGADYAGLNFFAASPRYLDLDAAAALTAGAPAIHRIGVFVDADTDFVLSAVAAGRLHGLQLHGSETPERVADLKRRTGIEVWKAVAVTTRAEIAAAAAFYGIADRILFDAKPPAGAALPGGMGVRFDWQLLAGYRAGAGWGLAGGLDASTVAEAIATTHAPLVDVSSGVEDAPGVKSPAKIRKFMEAVRAR